ncbi:multicomponent Na+:H+ antiporter subunit F [Dietzia sp. 2505]|uniref:monovalent cation/H+ antiporter complex subunit F n=1 Tax=Dietzia TaxID=37914 RepID=UPI0015FCD479|nr:monovalent cation/H+ antiporter complex subunit F [Dietzia natronolimnaea]MBB1039347.1 pesticidal protein Cry26Aa [Dietzia natronolimnaea]
MIVVDIAIVLVSIAAVLSSYRMVRGPHAGDRAIAADLLFFAFIALLALVGVRVDSPFVYDLVLVATLVGLVSALSLARLMSGGRR